MANIVMLLGKSGSGKSTSIKTLDPKETVVVNVLNKRLPFKGSTNIYNTNNGNILQLSEWDQICQFLEAVDKAPDFKHIKNVVLDDFIYCMRKEFFKRAKEVGYTKFTELAQHFQNIVSVCETARDNLNVFLILHSEEIYNDKNIVSYKAATVGSMVDTQ